MSTLQDARTRVASVLKEIDRLKQSEFPYEHPSDALDLLDERFKWHQSVLNKASEKTRSVVVHNACRDSLRELHAYVPILGFILRATNVRNAFETYGPLQRLAHKIMGTDTKLIVSSEWAFSPFIYRTISLLSGYVLIGLPAPESSNPLLLPLAGHELGHSVWEHEGFLSKFEKRVEDGIVKELIDNRWSDYSSLYPQYSQEDVKSGNMFATPTLRPAYTWAMLQIEETFCDIFGLRLFAESFLYAFAYLLSPGASGQRSLGYPNIKRRVSHLVEAAGDLETRVPEEYESSFEKEGEPTDPTTAMLVSLADAVSVSFLKELIELAREFADTKQVPMKNPDNVKEIGNLFRNFLVPIKKSASLVDILNSGWDCDMDMDLWKDVPQIMGSKDGDLEKNRDRVLRDIILKSMDIAEIYERLERPS